MSDNLNLNVQFNLFLDSIFSIYSNLLNIEGKDISFLNNDHRDDIGSVMSKEFVRIADRMMYSNLNIFFHIYLKICDKLKRQEKISEAENYLFSKINSINIYHYTSMFNFQNILKSRQLWFSSFDSMNDSEEGKFLKNYIHEVYFRDKFKTADEVPSLKKLEEYEKKLYSISFSTEADDSSQWDRYGDKGCGVCIVFSFKAFSQFFYNQFRFFEISPILYFSYLDKLEHNFLLDCQIASVFNYISQLETLIEELSHYAIFVKNQTFFHESELRLTVDFSKFEQEKIINAILANLYKIESNKFKLNLLNWCKFKRLDINPFVSLFDKIIIGPCSKTSAGDIKKILKNHGIKTVAVEKSNSTLVNKY